MYPSSTFPSHSKRQTINWQFYTHKFFCTTSVKKDQRSRHCSLSHGIFSFICKSGYFSTCPNSGDKTVPIYVDK